MSIYRILLLITFLTFTSPLYAAFPIKQASSEIDTTNITTHDPTAAAHSVTASFIAKVKAIEQSRPKRSTDPLLSIIAFIASVVGTLIYALSAVSFAAALGAGVLYAIPIIGFLLGLAGFTLGIIAVVRKKQFKGLAYLAIIIAAPLTLIAFFLLLGLVGILTS